jgi:pSer/pThr/pTyr-binding forkhead associated (FHA) protein
MNANLILFKRNGSQQAFSLPGSPTVIGRRHDCDLCVPLQVVSRKHCQLVQNNETVKIRDLDSRIGTFLNGKRISEATVQPGDYITIGPLTFLLQIDGKPEEVKPPQKPKAPTKKQAAPKSSADEPSGSFPGLDTDGDDSFLAELEDL